MRHLARILPLLFPLFFLACSSDDYLAVHEATIVVSDETDTMSLSALVEANRFVYEIMTDYYYWTADMPQLDYTLQTNTSNYFYSLLSDQDRFSYITDDADALLSQYDGEYTEMGWDYVLFVWSTDSVGAVVTYVYQDSPAYRAGITRGDIIVAVDGTTITRSNYSSLLNQEAATFTILSIADGEQTTADVALAQAPVTEAAVAETAIFELSDNTKVGYLLYMSYAKAFDADLHSAFQLFKSQGVAELILDLRYNRGGYVSSMQYLCSMIAPEANVRAADELMYYDYNDILTQYGYDRESTAEMFLDTVSVNLDLQRLVVLTGTSTYSASESTIWCLMPYMDVVKIGRTTGGKNSMMYLLSPSDFVYSGTQRPYFSTSINNYLIAPIVAVYKNTLGETFDTTDGTGLAPDFYVYEYANLLTTGLQPLGSEDETLLSAALTYLETGAVNKSVSVSGASTAERPRERVGGLVGRRE